jgi:hypothetical protein
MPQPNPARKLLSSFKNVGLTAAQVRRLMPQWWDDDAATDEGGLLEMQILLARRLNVSLDSLQGASPRPVFRETTQRFKTVHPHGSSQLAVAASIGHGLAQLLASASTAPTLPPGVLPSSVRNDLLREDGVVSLQNLCSWLWRHGVPVVHFTGWPDGLRRPDAMCVRVGTKPILMVVRKEVAPAKLTYLVAHEFGHVVSGHLRAEQNAVLVDDTLPVDAQRSLLDADEREADAFAMELLGGQALKAASESLVGREYTELTLAVAALSTSKDRKLDAGHVILGWSRLTDDWKLANLALRYLQTMQPAPVVINDVAAANLETSVLSADGRDHLLRLTGMDLPAA